MRLIDADNLNFEGQKYSKMQLKAILEFVDAQPTVVEGDFVTDTNADGKGWIPCSERLPEVGRCVICHAQENDEDSGEMLYGWYCGESKRNPSWSLLRFDSENWPLEYEDKVVAWHPLPEEYKPVRGELNAKEK